MSVCSCKCMVSRKFRWGGVPSVSVADSCDPIWDLPWTPKHPWNGILAEKDLIKIAISGWRCGIFFFKRMVRFWQYPRGSPGFQEKKVGLARGVALQKQQTGALLNFTWMRKLGDSATKIGKTWKTEFASTLWKVDRAIENNTILTHL